MTDETKRPRPRLFAWSCGVAIGLATAVAAAQPAYWAGFVAQTAPTFVEAQTTASISITMVNTGTATWLQRADDFFLATQEPQDNFYWCIQGNRYSGISGNRVLLPHDVAPGEQVTFNFVVKPLSCRFAAYSPLRFRMLSRIHGTFGEETPDPGVVVSGASEFVSQQVPTVMPAGTKARVAVTFKNTSPIAWQTTDGYTLRPATEAIGTTWRVTSVPLPTATLAGDTVAFTFDITAPTTTGTYDFRWQMARSDGQSFGQLSTATKIQVVTAAPANYQGLWWAAPAGSESGWGINFAHQGDTIFATWFTYDTTRRAWWLSMTATLQSPGAYTGTLFESTGPSYASATFDPRLVRLIQVGTGTLTFTGPDTASFAYVVNGVAQTKDLTRQTFGPQPSCTFGLMNPALAYNYQDLWWAAPAQSEAGWGVNLAQQGDTIFATWFTYDTDGRPLWLSATAPKNADGAYAGTLYRTAGPAFSATPFDGAQVTRADVGTATFTFTNGNSGTFAYVVNGVAKSKPITRQIFVPPGTVCQ